MTYDLVCACACLSLLGLRRLVLLFISNSTPTHKRIAYHRFFSIHFTYFSYDLKTGNIYMYIYIHIDID